MWWDRRAAALLAQLRVSLQRVARDVASRITTEDCWGEWGSTDQMRAPRVATLLQWHERASANGEFPPDSAVRSALSHFVAFVTSDRARFQNATGSCSVAHGGGFCLMDNTITTGMVGLAVADLLSFNSTYAWSLPRAN